MGTSWLAVALACMVAPLACAQVTTNPPMQRDAAMQRSIEPGEMEVLLSREVDPALRRAALAKLVALAQSGDGLSAFTLGALYRTGMDHPAKLVEREPDSARYWLEKCIDLADCPLLALASLAELELSTGRAKQAMQWAQAWVALEREREARSSAREGGDAGARGFYRVTSYHAYLIDRCYDAMSGAESDKDALRRAWFDELRRQRGRQLDRMLSAAVDASARRAGAYVDQGLEPSAENQRRKTIGADVPQPRQPALGLFLYRGNPNGGRAESVDVVEILPLPVSAFGLKLMTQNMRSKPYESTDGTRRFALIGMSFNKSDYYLLGEH